jgi:hypothetical protein
VIATPTPKPDSEQRAAEQVWFLDTSALVTPGVHPPLQQVVTEALSVHRRVLVKAVVVELEGLASTPPPEGKWAQVALCQLDWLGSPVRLDDPAGTDLALEVQEELAAGRGLRHPAEHFGEAAIIALASVRALSVHKLLHLMIRQSKIPETEAAEFADALHFAGRSLDYTAAELSSGKLGRVGRP